MTTSASACPAQASPEEVNTVVQAIQPQVQPQAIPVALPVAVPAAFPEEPNAEHSASTPASGEVSAATHVPQRGALLNNKVKTETGRDKLEVFILAVSFFWVEFSFFCEWVFFGLGLVPRVWFSYSFVTVPGVCFFFVFIGTRLRES